jgi:hypothetical protein
MPQTLKGRLPLGQRAKQVDQFRSLTLAQTRDRLRMPNPAATEHSLGLRGPDLRTGQQQHTQLRRSRTDRRIAEDLHKRQRARRKVTLQLRAQAAPHLPAQAPPTAAATNAPEHSPQPAPRTFARLDRKPTEDVALLVAFNLRNNPDANTIRPTW